MKFCTKCQALGIVRVVNEEEKLDSLAYCGCDWGKAPGHNWILPLVNEKLENAFKITACPGEWFRPLNERNSTVRGQLVASMAPKIQGWLKRLNDAEQMWMQWKMVFAIDLPDTRISHEDRVKALFG